MNPSNRQPTDRPRGATAPDPRSSAARALGLGVAAILVVWSVLSFGRQVRLSLRPPPGEWSPVFAWRARTPRVDEVRGFAERVGARVPEGEPILFRLGDGGDDEFFLSMWTAYSLPHHRVLRRQNVAPGASAPRYVLDVWKWPPDRADDAAPPRAAAPPRRQLLEGFGTLWFVPADGAEDPSR